MAMMDDILTQLEDMGINVGGGFSGIPSIDPTQVSGALGSQYGLDPSQLPSSLFQRISPDLVKGTSASTYTPQIESTGSTLLSNMELLLGGTQGRQAAGGFAGSGQQSEFVQGAKDVYGKGMTDVLTQTGQQRGQSLQAIQDLVNQWQSQALQVKGYQ